MAETPKMKLRIKTRQPSGIEPPETPTIEPPKEDAVKATPVFEAKPESVEIKEIDESKLLPNPVPENIQVPAFIRERAKAQGAEINLVETKKETPKVEAKVETPKTAEEPVVEKETPNEKPNTEVHQRFGELHTGDFTTSAADSIHLKHDVREIKSKQFFSERHKESVEKNNLLVEATRTNGNPSNVFSEEEFMKMLDNNFEGCTIKDKDEDYATAASRPVIAAANTYYSVIALNSGYKANMLGLCYLDKSRMNTVVEDPYAAQMRLFKIMYDKIESMTAGKPKFDEWLKMTSTEDIETLLYGIYSATYPTTLPFEVQCNKCKSIIKINTDPESIVANFNKDLHDEMAKVLYETKTRADIKKIAPMNRVKAVPILEKRSVIYFKQPSLQKYLDNISFFNSREKELADYLPMMERVLYIDSILIPDIAANEKDGTKAMVRVTDINIILKFVSSLSSDDAVKLIDGSIDDITGEYRVSFEIPKFKCNNLLKDENGMITGDACGNEIGPIDMNIENLLFFRVRRAFQKDNK